MTSISPTTFSSNKILQFFFVDNFSASLLLTSKKIGKGKILPINIKKIINSKDRSQAGATAPAHGLYLTKVEY